MAEKQPECGSKEAFDVFICFSYEDEDISLIIKKKLEDIGNLKCFHSEKNFDYGATVCANILKGICGSKKLLILLSQNWVDSKFPKYEVSEFQIYLYQRE